MAADISLVTMNIRRQRNDIFKVKNIEVRVGGGRKAGGDIALEKN